MISRFGFLVAHERSFNDFVLIWFLLDEHQTRLGTKGEMLVNRNLNVYLNQLRRAKSICERCITAKGGRSYLIFDTGLNKENFLHRKVRERLWKRFFLNLRTNTNAFQIIRFKLILSSITGRNHFHQFLETFGTHSLLKYWQITKICFEISTKFSFRFWHEVWKLRQGKYSFTCQSLTNLFSLWTAPKKETYLIANKIFDSYILKFGSAVRDEIDDTTVNRMKLFLLAAEVGRCCFFTDSIEKNFLRF